MMSFAKILALCLCFPLTLPAAEPPFAGAAADYGGIIEDTTGTAPDNSGIMTVTLRESGRFTAKLVWQGQAYSFVGLLDNDGNFEKTNLKKKLPVTPGTFLTVKLELTIDTLTIDGSITDPDGSDEPVTVEFQLSGQPPDPIVTAQLDPGLRIAFIDPTIVDAPNENAPENGAAETEVTEDGFAIVTVGKTAKRSSRFAGRLPDNQNYSAGSPIRGGQYALRAGLYSQKKLGPGGQLLGTADASSSIGAAAEGNLRSPRAGGGVAALTAALRWHKKAGVAKTNAYPNGIRQRVNLDTIPYNKNRDFSYVLTGVPRSSANATMRLTRGNLVNPNPIEVQINATIFGAKIVGPNPYGVKLSVNPKAAKFSGSFKHPETSEKIKFAGSFRSFLGLVPGEGRGNFLSVPNRNDPSMSNSGSVRITVN